jgi:amino acid transporter
VYSVIGAAAGLAGEGLWLSFMVGAIVATLTALSYAEMATAFPAAGAEYVYVRRALPEVGWLSILTAAIILFGGASTAATVAIAFGGYLGMFIDVDPLVGAGLILAFCTTFNLWGIREASWLNALFTSIEVAGLVLIIAAGLTRNGFLHPLATAPTPGVLPATAVIFFVYLGFEEIANLSEEVRKPARDIPIALFVSLGITTVLYVLVALAAVALVPPGNLAASNAPLATALQAAWPQATWLLSAIALFATANTVLITLIATSRVAFSMARGGDLPAILGRVGATRRTPWTAGLLLLLVSLVLLPLGDLKLLAEVSSFSALMAFLAVNLSLIILRYRLPGQRRPFTVPLAIGRMPILPVFAIASIGVLLASFDPTIVAISILLIVATVSLAARQYINHIRAGTIRSPLRFRR